MPQRPEIPLKKRWLGLWPGQATCVEPTLGSTVGAADTWLAFGRYGMQVEGWLEFKVVDEQGRIEPNRKQVLWHGDQLRDTTHVAFCAVSDAGFWLIPSSYVLRQASIHHPGVEHLGWDEVEDILVMPRLLAKVYQLNA